MDTFRVLLAAASLLEAVLTALFATAALVLERWGLASADDLRPIRRAWVTAFLALAANGISAFLDPSQGPAEQGALCLAIAIGNVCWLWNAAFVANGLRRISWRVSYEPRAMRHLFVWCAVLGALAAVPMAAPFPYGEATIAARLLVHAVCALAFAYLSWLAMASAGPASLERPWPRRLYGAGTVGSMLSHLLLVATLPELIRIQPPSRLVLLLPVVSIIAFICLAFGCLLNVLQAKRRDDARREVALAQAEESASAASSQLEAALVAIGEAAVTIDTELRVMAWNAPFAETCRAVGVTPTTGLPCQAMMTPEIRPTWERAWEGIRRGESARFRVVRMVGDKQRTLDVRAEPIRQGSTVVGAMAILHDLTDVLELEARFHHAQRSEAIGRLAQGVAHDFNNLIAAISLTVELAEGDESPAESLRDIRAIADRGREMTRHLLSMARHRTDVADEEFNVGERLEAVGGILRRLVSADVTLEISPPAVPVTVRMGAGHFEQIVLNLVVNAQDAMPSGGAVRVDAKTLTAEERRWVEVRVSDTGVGMPPDVVARALEPYFTTKAEDKGTGLGLSTCQDLTQHAGGTLSITSVVGSGTTVTVRLPVVAMGAQVGGDDPLHRALLPATPPSAMAIIPSADDGDTRPVAVLAEDDPLVRRQLARSLERAGFRTVACDDGHEALLALRSAGSAVALVVSDVMMPRLDGPSWVRQARAKGYAGPVLFISGFTQQKLAPRDMTDLRAAFLSKPFAGAALRGAIDDARRVAIPTASAVR